MAKTLLLHVPALHQGYVKVFEEWAPQVDQLAIVGPDVIAGFPDLVKEVRALKPEQMAEAIKGLSLFKKVSVVSKNDLKKMAGQEMVISDEEISDVIIKKYFSKSTVDRVNVFLRWDTKNVQVTNEVAPDRIISRAKFDREMIKKVELEADKSSDWFRHVGAIVIKDGEIILATHNKRQPSAHTPYIEADPRNFIPYGTDVHLRTTMHAEQGIIANAAKKGISLEGTSLYVNVFPCPDCAQMVAHCGIKKCYYASGYASLDGERILKAFGVEIILVQ